MSLASGRSERRGRILIQIAPINARDEPRRGAGASRRDEPRAKRASVGEGGQETEHSGCLPAIEPLVARASMSNCSPSSPAPPQTSLATEGEALAKPARDQPDSWDARPRIYLPFLFWYQDEGSGPPLPSNSDMKVKMKRFVLITLAACVAIDVVALWMLW
jgi:hypothetical protein